MNKRLRKKKGLLPRKFRNQIFKNSESNQYKKGWGRFEEHHIENCSRGGKDCRGNKKMIIGKIHFCWHKIFGNQNPSEAKLFLFYFLCGDKAKWKIKEISQLEQHIKSKQYLEASKISQLQVVKRYVGLENCHEQNLNYKNFTIGSKKVNDNFLWCWKELFGRSDVNVIDAQIFITLFLEGRKERWSAKEVSVLNKMIKNNKIKEARIFCIIRKEYIPIVHYPDGFVSRNAVSLAA
jgi:hypothetical protein